MTKWYRITVDRNNLNDYMEKCERCGYEPVGVYNISADQLMFWVVSRKGTAEPFFNMLLPEAVVEEFESFESAVTIDGKLLDYDSLMYMVGREE